VVVLVFVVGRTAVNVNQRIDVIVEENPDRVRDLPTEGLRKPGEHLDDTVVSGAQLLIGFVRDIVQVSGEQELIANLAAGSTGDAHKLAVLLTAEPHGPFHKIHSH
jgi:hypothetical protein